MERATEPQRIETVIVGAGQAGLATAYHLRQKERPCVVLDASARIGDQWREHWDSLRLFTPAPLSRLAGMPPATPGWTFPTKDEFAAYLEAYAERYALDVRTGVRVEGIERSGDGYLVSAGSQRFLADHVVLATGAHREPKVPIFAPELDEAILQLHSSAYKNPDQLQPGNVLIVGSANSGAEISLDLARGGREVTLAGRDVSVFPVRPERLPARVFMRMFLFAAMRVLTTSTPLGRRARLHREGPAPLVRVKPRDLARAGVTRTGRVAGIEGGRPRLEDGTVLDVQNVIWCTGFEVDFSWIDVPACATGDEPVHDRGVFTGEPGMYMVGQLFQYALASTFIAGVGRDAKHIARVIESRARERARQSEQLVGERERSGAGGLAR